MGLWAAIAIAPLSACAGILGIEDGHLRGDGGAPDATTGDDGSSPLGGDSGGEDAAALGDDSSPPLLDGGYCDPAQTLASTGVFVAANGGNDQGPCSKAEPCATINGGISAALTHATPPPVYVQGGRYVEPVTLQAGIVLVGGWSTSWLRDCSATILQALPGTPVTVVASYSGTATLSSVVVESEIGSAVRPGETVVGILASGSGTELHLEYVQVSMTGGGNGAAGDVGDAGTTPVGCAAPGDAGSATVVGGKGNGADAGWFAGTGFQSLAGGVGGTGAAGANGTAGGPGACQQCIDSCGGTVSCGPQNGAMLCGDAGLPGCGGAGGGGGVGGQTGGSSVAVLVGGATVLHSNCTLQAGNGGLGGAGGPGGAPGKGGAGESGALSASCKTTCGGLLGSCTTTSSQADGGTAGGPGGGGAAGGPGGDGAGGDSYAVVKVGGASVFAVETDGGISTLDFGLPGFTPDGGNGAPGQSGKTLQQ